MQHKHSDESAKTKDKILKILQGRNAQDGKEQKKKMVYLE